MRATAKQFVPLGSGILPLYLRSSSMQTKINNMTNSFLSLPEELISAVFDVFDIDHSDRRRTSARKYHQRLVNLYHSALTCQKLFRIVYARCYKEIHSGTIMIYHLLRKIVREPTLAQNLQRVCWDQWTNCFSKTFPALLPCEIPDLHQFGKTLGYDHEAVAGPWVPMDGLVAILLLSPNLQSLNIDECIGMSGGEAFRFEVPAWLSVLTTLSPQEENPGISKAYFRNLTTLRLRTNRYLIDTVLPILGLTSLRSLTLECKSYPVMSLGPTMICPPRSSPIKKLYLSSCWMPTWLISNLLECITTLEVFQVSFAEPKSDWSMVTGHNPPRVDYAVLSAALELHKDSLTTLDITDRRRTHTRYRDGPTRSVLCLGELSRLTTLNISINALYNPCVLHSTHTTSKRLPDSLEVLGLIWQCPSAILSDFWNPDNNTDSRVFGLLVDELAHASCADDSRLRRVRAFIGRHRIWCVRLLVSSELRLGPGLSLGSYADNMGYEDRMELEKDW